MDNGQSTVELLEITFQKPTKKKRKTTRIAHTEISLPDSLNQNDIYTHIEIEKKKASQSGRIPRANPSSKG